MYMYVCIEYSFTLYNQSYYKIVIKLTLFWRDKDRNYIIAYKYQLLYEFKAYTSI
jgi:hypothetical protein